MSHPDSELRVVAAMLPAGHRRRGGRSSSRYHGDKDGALDRDQTQADHVIWTKNASTGQSIASGADTALKSVANLLTRAKELVPARRLPHSVRTGRDDGSCVACERDNKRNAGGSIRQDRHPGEGRDPDAQRFWLETIASQVRPDAIIAVRGQHGGRDDPERSEVS